MKSLDTITRDHVPYRVVVVQGVVQLETEDGPSIIFQPDTAEALARQLQEAARYARADGQ